MRTTIIAAAVVAACALAPNVHAAPCAGFTDVEDTNPFCGSIAWMKNRAITLGCTSPTLYCPDQFVRRDQMAAFMWRLGFQNAFLNGGNAFGGTATLGSTDNEWVNIIVNGARVMSYRPDAISPNIVGGHANNIALPTFHGQTIGGGGKAGVDCYDPETTLSNRTCGNATLESFATVGGGYSNIASGEMATVVGGGSNSATAPYSVVGGGHNNMATTLYAAVLSGGGNVASGMASVVLNGFQNHAAGALSLAAGGYAAADQHSCGVLALWSTPQVFSCLGSTNIFRFGADHGLSVDYFGRRPDGGGTRWVYMGDIFAGRTINTWSGAHLTDAGVWVNASSSQAAKTDFASVDAQAVLAKVAALPITTWRYREGEEDVRHIGPMAEDFHAAFGVGYGPHTIADLDARGVAFAAIQGLHQRLREKDAELAAQRAATQALEVRLSDLRRALDALAAGLADRRATRGQR